MPVLAEIEAKITADTSSFDAGMAKASSSLDTIGSKAQTQSQSMQTVGIGLAGIGAAAGVGFGAAVGAAADFEFQMDAVNAAMGGLDTGQMEAVEEQALALGASSKFSAGEITGVQEALGKAGISVETVLDGATDAVTNMAAATGEDLTRSGEAAAAAINLFGLEGEEVTGVADTFTAALNNSSATLSDMRTGINNLGPVMSNLNQYAGDGEEAFTDTAAAVAYFNAQGLKAADAGVSLARGMTNLANPTSKASAVMEQLGISAFDASGNFLPLPDIMDNLSVGMAGMSDEAREAALATIFGAEAADVMNIAIKNGGEGLRQYEADMVASGQAAEQAAIRQDNLSGAMEALGGSISTAVVAIGQGFIPILTTAAKGISTLVNAFIELPKPVQTAVGAVTGLVAILGVGLGGAILIVPKIMAFAQAWGVVTAALKETALASKLLAVGFGPIGIALAVIGAAIVAYQTNFLGFRDIVNEIASRVFPALVSAAQAVGSTLRDVFSVLGTVPAQVGQGIGQAVDYISEKIQGLRDVFQNISLDGISQAIMGALQGASDALQGWLNDAASWIGSAFDNLPIPQGIKDFIHGFIDNFTNGLDVIGGKIDEWWGNLQSLTLPDGLQRVADWFGTTFGTSVDDAIDDLARFNAELAKFEAGEGFMGMGEHASDPAVVWIKQQEAAERMAEAVEMAKNGVRGLNDTWISGSDFASQFAHAVDTVSTSQDAAAASAAAAGEELSELQKEWLKTFHEVLDPTQAQGFVASITMAIPPMQSVLQVLTKIGDMGFPIQDQQFANFVASLETANAGLTTTLNTMGQIQALGSSLQGAADIATKLVGDPGVYATVDDLLNKNLISIDLYNGAQRAQISTVEANARAQEALNVMMVQQIPLLGHQAQLYADQLVALSKMPAAEQQLALAMMDTATQAKIAGAASAVYSAALGEIPSDIATDLVANAARADPIIADLLDKYGIIELGAEGEITVIMPDVSNIALEKFRAAFEGQQVREIDGLIHVTTASGTELVYDQFNNLVEQNGTTITASVDLQFKGFEAGAASGQGFGATFDNIGTDVANLVTDSVAKADFSASGDAVQANLGTALAAVDVSAETAELATTVTGDLSTGITDDAAAVELAATAVVTDAVEAAGTEAATANEAGAKLVQSIGDQITTDSGSVSTKLSLSVTDAVTAATTSAATAITVGQQMATSTVEGITQYDLNISTALTGSVDSAIAAATLSAGAATGVGQEMINILVGGIENVEANVSTALSGAVGTATTDATNKATEAKTVGSTLITNIGVGVTGAQGELTSVLQNAVLGAIQGVSSLAGAATEAGTAIGTALGAAVGAGAAAAMPAVRGQIESALSGLSINVPVSVNVTANINQQSVAAAEDAAMDAAAGLGGNFTGTYNDTVNAGVPAATEAGENLVGGTIDGAAAVGGIHSPSTVMYQMGQDMIAGFTLGVIDGVPGLYDLAGQMIAPLSDLELDLALLAHQQGEAYLYAFVDTLRNGSDWVIDEAGVIADQFGSTLAADFTAALSDTKDVYTGFGEQLGAMVTEGMASGGWTEEATMIAKDAGVATGAEYAAGVTETTPAIADAMTTLTDTATAPLAQMPIDTCTVATDSVNTMASCIADGGTAVADAAAQVGTQATDTLRATLPDMAEIGAMMTDETSKGARGRSRDLSDAIKANLDEGVNLGRVVSRTASQIGNDLVTASVAGVRQTVQQLHASITQSVQQSIATGTSTSRGAVQTGTTLMTSAADGVRSNAGKITTGTSNAINNAIGAGQSTAGGADVIGTELGSGIATGLVDQIPAIEEAARKAVRAAIDAAKDEADISSPSKVARHEIGRMWGEGLALGIADMADDVATASESLMGSMDSPGRASLSPAFLAAGGIPGHSDMHPGRGGDGGSGSVHIGTVNLPGVQNAQQFVDEIRQIAREQGVSAARRVR